MAQANIEIDIHEVSSSQKVCKWLANVKTRLCIPKDWNPPAPLRDGVQNNDQKFILKIPNYLVNTKKGAYVPQMISLGPYIHRSVKHDLSDSISEVEQLKLRVARRMIISDENGKQNKRIDFQSFVGTIMELDDVIRNSYEEPIPYNAEILAYMITLDACFLLEFLRSYSGKESTTKCKFFVQNHRSAILADIVKLQNQIPLIVLIKLLELETKSENEAENKLQEMLYNGVIGQCYPFSFDSIRWPLELRSKAHILDVLSSVIVESFSEQQPVTNSDGCALISKIEGFLCMPCLRKQPTEEDREGGMSYTSLSSTPEGHQQQQQSEESHVRDGASDQSQENRQQEGTCRWHNLITKVGGFVCMPCSRGNMDPNGFSWQSSLP